MTNLIWRCPRKMKKAYKVRWYGYPRTWFDDMTPSYSSPYLLIHNGRKP